MNDRLKNYVTVKERIMEFREQYGHKGRIITSKTVEKESNPRILSFQTEIFIPEVVGPIATGHSEVVVSKQKVCEFGETVSVGRALALAGFSVDKGIGSYEENKSWADAQDEKVKVPNKKGAQNVNRSDLSDEIV